MSALLKPRDLDPSPTAEAVIEDFLRDGVHLFAEPLDQAACARLAADIRGGRELGAGLFLPEAEAEPDAPVEPGRNMLDRFEGRLGFVERAPRIVDGLTALLGADYEVLERRVVCTLPATAVPDWLRERRRGGSPRDLPGDLTGFVRRQHRDMTYLCGEDFHQDPAPEGARRAEAITLYVALETVGRADGPPCLLEGSHLLGGSRAPHNLTRIGDVDWLFVNKPWGETVARQRVVAGEAGLAALWHSCTLHGAQAEADGQAKLSLRYRLIRHDPGRTGLDVVNARVTGPL